MRSTAYNGLGQTTVIESLRDHVALRRHPAQMLIPLRDGQRRLETARLEVRPQDEHTVDILDLMHVVPRIWQAAHLFHNEDRDEAEH